MEGVLNDSSLNSSPNNLTDEEIRKKVILGDLSNNFIEENDRCIIFNITTNLDGYNTDKYKNEEISFNSFT